MEMTRLIALLAEPLDLPIIVTDADLTPPGPLVTYVNPAFENMSGYNADEIVGRSPNILQGRGTSSTMRVALARALQRGRSFRGCLTNYRKNGDRYFCDIHIVPLRSDAGELQAFVGFEREVKRKKGRPQKGDFSRFQSIEEAPSAELERLFARGSDVLDS